MVSDINSAVIVFILNVKYSKESTNTEGCIEMT